MVKNGVETFYKLLHEESILDLDIFIKDYDLFEEIPLISRYHRLARIEQEWGDDTQSMLISFANFYLYQIYCYAKNQKIGDDWVSFLTFPNIEDHNTELMVPNFLVTRKTHLFNFIDLNNDDIKLFPKMYIALKKCGLLSSYKYFLSRDADNNPIRLYFSANFFKKDIYS